METTLYDFNINANTAAPSALVMGPDGSLYGTTSRVDLLGEAFRLMPPTQPGGAWTASFPYKFNSSGLNGFSTLSALLIGSDGTLYGTAANGPALAGGVFALIPPQQAGGAWQESDLHVFTGAPNDAGFGNTDPAGNWPAGGLVEQSGAYYGVTILGGANGAGAFYQLTPPSPSNGNVWTEALLYSFSQSGDSWFPIGPLTPGPDGVFYGVSSATPSGKGAIFALTPPSAPGGSWTETAIHTFVGGGDGLSPNPGLVMLNGNLYGTTASGGAGKICAPVFSPQGCGTVFSLTPPASSGDSWTESVVYSFVGVNGDAAIPTSGLAAGPNGVLYGTTFWGGKSNLGAVYQITP
jgi:hypothetical protein